MRAACFNSPLSRPVQRAYAGPATRPTKQKAIIMEDVMPPTTPVSRRQLLSLLSGSIAASLISPRMVLAQEAWPVRSVHTSL